ncbi:MAG: DUF2892 domain-containing protein [Pseudomonadota bacterium]
MRYLREKLAVQENMGAIDRGLRLLFGFLLLVPIFVIIETIEPPTWQWFTTLVSFYLLLTAMVGWDPVYAMLNRKTCGTSDKNRCGTLGYEIKAAAGENPGHDKGYQTKALKDGEKTKETNSPGYTI